MKTARNAPMEKHHQERFTWRRSGEFETYNLALGHFQVQAGLEHARGRSALDMPCGDGALTEEFCQHFERVVGVDASAQHLALARARLPNVEFHESLIEDVRLNERFDSIFMLNVLEHVIDPATVLRKAASLLAPGGVVIVHVPNADAINRRIAVAMGTLLTRDEMSPYDINVAGHRRSYTLAGLIAETQAAGLRVVATGGVFYKMLSTPQMDWLLKNGPWEEGGFGWGRVGAPGRDWRAEFCRACYEIGKERPEDCNIVFVVAERERDERDGANA